MWFRIITYLLLLACLQSFMWNPLVPKNVKTTASILMDVNSRSGDNTFGETRWRDPNAESRRLRKIAASKPKPIKGLENGFPTTLESFRAMVNTHVVAQNLTLKEIKFHQESCEITVARRKWCRDIQRYVEDIYESPNVQELGAVSRSIFTEMESNEVLRHWLEQLELIVTTPGVSGFLTSDRDFKLYMSYPVRVNLKIPFRHRTNYDGFLVGRNVSHVHLGIRGVNKVIDIPREFILEVKLRHTL